MEQTDKSSSTPGLHEFDPRHIPYQYDVINLIRGGEYDYSRGYLEVLLSGAVGSAKSILAAHIGITHCLLYSGSRVGIARRALPDQKRTIYQKCKEHLKNTDEEMLPPSFYRCLDTVGSVKFGNGSEMVGMSWADGLSEKVRSLELSGLIIEEAVENRSDKDKRSVIEATMRVGRLPHVPETWILWLTNPDDPDHWIYDRFSLQIDEPEEN